MKESCLPLAACVFVSLVGYIGVAAVVAQTSETSRHANVVQEPPLTSVTWTCDKVFGAPEGIFFTDIHVDPHTSSLILASTARIFELTSEWHLSNTRIIERPQGLSGEGNHHFVDVDDDGNMELINLGEADLRGVALYYSDGRLAWISRLYDQYGFQGDISYVIPSRRKDGVRIFYVLSQLSASVVTLDTKGKIVEESTWDRLNTPHALRWGDIDGDGSTEIFYGCLNALVVRDASGAALWRERLKSAQFVNIIRELPGTATFNRVHVQASANGNDSNVGQNIYEWRWPIAVGIGNSVVVPCHEDKCAGSELAGDILRSFQYRGDRYYAVASTGSPQGNDGQIMGRAARVVICNANGTVIYQRVLIDETAGRFLTGASMEVLMDKATPTIALCFGGTLWKIAPTP